MKTPTRSSHAKKVKKPSVKAPREKAPKAVSGLCVNCALRDTCTFPGRASGPVFHCEEYRCEGAGCAEPSPARPSSAEAGQPCEATDFKGLCVNCENRFDCTFPKPPGGVWHCQEYR